MHKLVLILATMLVSSAAGAASTPSPAPSATSATTSKTTINDEPLPSSEIALRRLTDETEAELRNLDQTERELRLVGPILEQNRSTLPAPSKEALEQALVALEKALSEKNYKTAKDHLGTVMRLFRGVFDSSSNGLYRVQSQLKDPEVVGIVTRLESSIENVSRDVIEDPQVNNWSRLAWDRDTAIKEGDLDISKLRESLSYDRLSKLRASILDATQSALADAARLSAADAMRVAELRTRLGRINAELERPRTEINILAIQWGIPAFCSTVLLMYLASVFASLWTSRIAPSNQDENSPQATLPSGVLIELITVFLLTMTTLILGLARILNGDVLGTLLGGISGYVLNRVKPSGKP